MLRWKIAQWFEIRWWESYLGKKDKRQYLDWKRNYWKQLLATLPISNNFNGQAILDAGCGPAGVFIALPESRVTAIDPLLSLYEKKLPLFCKADYPNVDFVHTSIEAFTPAPTFDKVFCMNAINHTHQLNIAFDNLVGALKQDGHLILTVDAHVYKGLQLLFKTIPGDVLHPHQYTLQQYQAMLTERKLQVTYTGLIKSGSIFNHYVIVAKKIT